jgi:hypothetical protein
MALGTAVIVGVGPGLGVALARAFANAGHPVAMLDIDKARLDTDAAELASTGQDVRGYVADAADPGNLRAALHSAITELGAPDVLVYTSERFARTRPSAVTTRTGPTARPSGSWAPGSRPTPSCQSCVMAAGACCSQAAASRCTPARNAHPCPSARPRCARTCKYFTTSWRERACTRPSSRSPRGSAANRASTRQRSPGHTSNCTTSPRPNGSPSLSSNLPASAMSPALPQAAGRPRGTRPAET